MAIFTDVAKTAKVARQVRISETVGNISSIVNKWGSAGAPVPDTIRVVALGQSGMDELFTSRDVGASNDGQVAFQNTLTSLTGTSQTIFLNGSAGASAISSSAESSAGNSWWNVVGDAPTTQLVSTTDSLVASLAGNDADVIMIQAGGRDALEIDVVNGTTQAEYIDSFQKVINYVLGRIGTVGTTPVLLARLGRRTDFSNGGAGQLIREAEDTLAASNSNYGFLADCYDLDLTDTVHLTDAANAVKGTRYAHSVAGSVYGTPGIVPRGPRITTVSVNSTTELDVTVTYPDGGSDFTAGVNQFSVLNPSSEIAISSVTRINSSTVRITLSAAYNTANDLIIYPIYDRMQFEGSGAVTVCRGNDVNQLPFQPMPVNTIVGSGGGGGFSPDSLSNKLVYLDASDTSSVVASPLAITDKSGTLGSTLTVTNGTVGYSTTTGDPESFFFNDAADRLEVANAAASSGQAAWAATGPGEIWLRVLQNATATYVMQWINQGSSGNGGYQIRTNTNGTLLQFVRFSGSAGTDVWETDTSATPIGQWTTIHIEWDGSSPNTAPVIRLNNGAPVALTATDGVAAAYAQPTTQTFKIGNNDNGNRGIDGRVAFVLFRNAIATAQERTDMTNYLSQWS